MKRALLVLSLAIGGTSAHVAFDPTPALAQTPRPKAPFRVGEKVEVQTDDGRWYAASVQRVKGTDEVLLQLVNFPRGSDTWFKTDRVRAAGGGEIVDPAYVAANFALRDKFRLSQAFLEQGRWGDAEWEKSALQQIEALTRETDEMEKRWPGENTAPMRDGVAWRRELYEKNRKAAPPPAAIPADEAAALEAVYRVFHERAKELPFELGAEDVARRPEILERFDLAALDKKLAEDRARYPHVFQYYGMDEKGRFGDLPWGGQKRPSFDDKNIEKLNTYYLKDIFQARAKLAKGEAEITRGVELAIERGKTELEAKHAIRVANAVKTCMPGFPNIEALIAAAEANAVKVAAGPAKPAEAKPTAAPAKVERPVGKVFVSEGARYPTIPDPKGTNIVFGVYKGSTNQAYRENQLCELEEGLSFNASAALDDAARERCNGKRVTFTMRLKGGADLLAEKSWEEAFDDNRSINVAPVPVTRFAPWPHWSGCFAAALDRLAPGTHGLTLHIALAADGHESEVGRGAIRYKATGSGAYKALATQVSRIVGETLEGVSAGDPSDPLGTGVRLTFHATPARGGEAKAAFTAGDFIYAQVAFPSPILHSLSPEYGEQIFWVLYVSLNGKDLGYWSAATRSLHLQREQTAGSAGYLVLPIVSDPSVDCVNYSANLFNGVTPKQLAELPAGEHALEVRLESSAPQAAGFALAKATLRLTVTAEGKAALEKHAAAADQASAQRGGEVVQLGLRLEGKGGFQMTIINGQVTTNRGAGKWADNAFYQGIVRLGRRSSDSYMPDGAAHNLFVKRVEGGYSISKGGQVVAKVLYDGSVLDRDGAKWGAFTNEFEKVLGAGDLLEAVGGLYHFSDLLR